MPSHFSESRDPNYRPCVQNVPGKNFSGYSLHPRESGPKFVQRPGSVTTSPTLLGPVLVEPAELSDIAVDCEVSGPPRQNRRQKIAGELDIKIYQNFH